MDGLQLSLAGSNALVTGASSGLGSFIARKLDEAGASVAIHYHQNVDGANSLAAQLSQPSTVLQADLDDVTAMQQLFAQAIKNLGPISILINCAATESQNQANLADIDASAWAKTQRTNVDAPLALTQAFAAQGNAGSIINISSIEGSRPAPGHGHYSTSKAALEMLTRASALEFGSLGIRVNAIAPGLIHREGIEEGWPEGVEAWNQSAPLGKLVDPEDIAAATVFLASDHAKSITGTVLTIDCGLSIKPGW
jgi:NAD(P)-dependent dehydrogenase (short-subunit alcohol dehydrogenase family)